MTGIAQPVFGITVRCGRCLGKGAYRPATGKRVDPCPMCFGEGFVNRQSGPPR